MTSTRVVITGQGLVSSLGIGVNKAWGSLLNKQSGIRLIRKPEFADLTSRIAAFVDDEDLQPHIEGLIDRSKMKSMSRSTIFTILAAEEALQQANWKPVDVEAQNYTGVSIGVSLDSLQEIYDVSLQVRDKGPHRGIGPFFLLRMLSNMAAAHTSLRYGFRGPQMCASTACATGTHAIGDGFRMIRSGAANVMVCGAAEAPISPLTMAAFCKIRALCTDNDSPSTSSCPFDERRSGFVFAEGSSIMVLEELEHARARGAEPIAEILGFGSSGDGHHLTAPDPSGDGALRSMKAALKDAEIAPSKIGLVNAHATSTPIGDAVESNAIAKLTAGNSKPVLVTSNKGATGHQISACGPLEGIFTALSCKEGIVPPTLNLTNPNTNEELDYVMKDNREWTSNIGRRVALSNSFGFGGVNGTLCIGEFLH